MLGQMKLNTRVTSATVDLVKRFEPLCQVATRLADGSLLIGYGHSRFAKDGAVISEQDADMLLRYDLSEIANALDGMLLLTTNDHQFEALTSFAFDVGIDSFANSSVLKQINLGAYTQAADAISLWRLPAACGRGHSLPDQIRRRSAEAAHFLTSAAAGSAPRVAASTFWQPPQQQGAVREAAHSTPVVSSLPSDAPAGTVSELAPRWSPPPRATAHRQADVAPVVAPVQPLLPEDSVVQDEPHPPTPLSDEFGGFQPGPSLFDGEPQITTDARVLTPETAHDIRREPRAVLGSNLAYIVLGLLGVMLFVGALVSMMRHASFSNLVAGLVGVLFMAPSAGHILFSAIGPSTRTTRFPGPSGMSNA